VICRQITKYQRQINHLQNTRGVPDLVGFTVYSASWAAAAVVGPSVYERGGN